MCIYSFSFLCLSYHCVSVSQNYHSFLSPLMLDCFCGSKSLLQYPNTFWEPQELFHPPGLQCPKRIPIWHLSMNLAQMDSMLTASHNHFIVVQKKKKKPPCFHLCPSHYPRTPTSCPVFSFGFEPSSHKLPQLSNLPPLP